MILPHGDTTEPWLRRAPGTAPSAVRTGDPPTHGEHPTAQGGDDRVG